MAAQGSRDILWWMRAKNDASGEVNRLSKDLERQQQIADRTAKSMRLFAASLAAHRIGQGMERFGRWIKDHAKAALDMAVAFDHGQRLIRTQLDMTDRQYRQMGRNVIALSKEIPLPMEQIQEGLYDILSSMDVTTKQGVVLTRKFSKAAVAGNVDIRSSTRAAIGALNAYDLPLSRANRVLDIQFQLVRKGVGTYEEFIGILGDVYPSAVASGQSLNDVSAALAFTTRNGLNTSKAGISVARALDMLTRPNYAEDLKKILGVDVIDPATGGYRRLTDIIGDLGKSFEDLTKPERKAALAEVFGAGEIRANRFFNIAINKFDQLREMTNLFANEDVKGAMGGAFRIMAGGLGNQLQVIKNHFNAIVTLLAKTFFPEVRRFLDLVERVLNAFEDLPGPVKRFLAQLFLVAGAFSLVGGKMLIFIGNLIGMRSLMMLAQVSFAQITTTILASIAGFIAVTAAVAALAAGAFWLVANWDKVSAWWQRNWETIRNVLIAISPIIIAALVAIGTAMWQDVALRAMYMGDAVVRAFKMMVGPIVVAMRAIGAAMLANPWLIAVAAVAAAVALIIMNWDTVKKWLVTAWEWIKEKASAIWGAISGFFEEHGRKILTFMGPIGLLVLWIIDHWETVKSVTITIFTAIWNFLKEAWALIVTTFQWARDNIWPIVKEAFALILTTTQNVMGFVVSAFRVAWNVVKTIFDVFWAVFWPVIKTAFQILWKYLEFVWGILEATWKVLWAGIKMWWENFGRPTVHIIAAVFGWLWDNILQPIWERIKVGWQVLWGGIKVVWTNIGEPIAGFIGDAFSAVWDKLKIIWKALTAGFSVMWAGIKAGTIGAVNAILSGVEMFVNGIITALNWVRDKFGLEPLALWAAPRIGEAGGGSDVRDAGTQQLARGTRNWKGGPAVVGEEGPELVYLPKNAVVLPNKMLNNLPGFAAGLNLDFIGKGASWLLNKGMNAVGATGLRMPGMPELGAAITKQTMGWAMRYIKSFTEGIVGSPGGGGLVAIAKWLQQLGFIISEHPLFGGVSPVHTRNSWHYKGRAFDANYYPYAMEPSMIQKAYAVLKNVGGIIELLIEGTPGLPGYHMHVAMANGGTIREKIFGVGKSGTTYTFGEAGPEDVVPRRGGGYEPAIRAGRGLFKSIDFSDFGYGGPSGTIRRIFTESLMTIGRAFPQLAAKTNIHGVREEKGAWGFAGGRPRGGFGGREFMGLPMFKGPYNMILNHRGGVKASTWRKQFHNTMDHLFTNVGDPLRQLVAHEFAHIATFSALNHPEFRKMIRKIDWKKEGKALSTYAHTRDIWEFMAEAVSHYWLNPNAPKIAHKLGGAVDAVFGGRSRKGVMAMARGGIIREPITGIGLSGQVYKFGERGDERVTPLGATGTDGTTVFHYEPHFENSHVDAKEAMDELDFYRRTRGW